MKLYATIAYVMLCVSVLLPITSGVGRGGERGLDAGSRSRVPVRVRRSKPYGNLGAKLYDYDTFTRPPKYKYLCVRLQSSIFNPCGTHTRTVRSNLPRTVRVRVPSTVHITPPPHYEYSTSTEYC